MYACSSMKSIGIKYKQLKLNRLTLCDFTLLIRLNFTIHSCTPDIIQKLIDASIQRVISSSRIIQYSLEIID